MIPEIVVGLYDRDVVDLCSLQDFAGRFRAANIRSRAHFAPFLEGATDTKLSPQTDDQRQPDKQQPVRYRSRNRMDGT